MAISNAVGGLEEEMGLPKDSLVSSISILKEDALFEEENQVTEYLCHLSALYSYFLDSLGLWHS